jgi:glucokinase
MPQRRIIGVDLGGTKLLAGAVDPDLGVHHRTQRTVTGLDQRALLDVAVDAVSETREFAGAEVEAVGFGIPVLMDSRTGTAVVGVNTPLAEIAFADVMAERLGLPVFVDNDGNCAALAEHRAGAAQGASEAIVLTLGTGIAGGLILRNELYRGALGAAGEIGHMVIDFDGPACQGNCPNRGCAEMFSSGTALAREAHLLGASRPNSGLERMLSEGREIAGPLVTELAHDGDAAAIEAIALIGSRLGITIANLINIFNPEVVVVGGGVIGAGELLLGPARASVTDRVLPFLAENVRIVAARFGVEAGMVGAAALAYDRIDRRAVEAA